MKTEGSARHWIVIGVLFVSWFMVWGGGANTSPVFFVPVLKTFGWSRTRLSFGYAVAAFSAGAAGPLIGWLVDRFDVRKVMVAGVAMVVCGYLALAHTYAYGQFVLINLGLGLGFVACTGIPASKVVANWFEARRGMAMGVMLSGASIGGAIFTPVMARVIAGYGWRGAYVMLAVLIGAITIPLLTVFLRSRPDAEAAPASAEREAAPTAPITLAGLEIKEALASRSLWLIALAQFITFSLWSGLGQHFVAYLVSIGYTPQFSSQMLGLFYLVTTGGTLLSGPISDRITARSAFALTSILSALSMLLMLGSRQIAALAAYVAVGGMMCGASGVLMPLLILETLGVKRYGALMGISGIFGTLGFAAGPVVTGRIFDLTGSYAGALWMFAAAMVVCTLAALACRRFEAAIAPALAASAVA
ncbi:MAG: MFS transporter [Deltaproteobacteria bacterium]|nr:MFS transporter [Deltaproteobacteria bacterium]